jgi:O-6-methylguanine DNA methyltransferase
MISALENLFEATDMHEMKQAVYDYLLTIPKGKVVTYKQIATALGNPKLARVVGNILHENPDEDRYPCFRVVNFQGRLAENFVFGGIGAQQKKLVGDGIEVVNSKVDLKKYQWKEK